MNSTYKILLTKELSDVPGKEGLIERVVLSPGEVVPRHRHNADVFAYVHRGDVWRLFGYFKWSLLRRLKSAFSATAKVRFLMRLFLRREWRGYRSLVWYEQLLLALSAPLAAVCAYLDWWC